MNILQLAAFAVSIAVLQPGINAAHDALNRFNQMQSIGYQIANAAQQRRPVAALAAQGAQQREGLAALAGL